MQLIANIAVLLGILGLGVVFLFFTKWAQKINGRGNEKWGLTFSARLQNSLASTFIYKLIGFFFIAASLFSLVIYALPLIAALGKH